MADLDELLQRALEIAKGQRRVFAAVLAVLIVRHAEDHGPLGPTTRQIASECGMPGEDARKALAVLKRLGYVDGSPDSWRITPHGIAAFPHFHTKE